MDKSSRSFDQIEAGAGRWRALRCDFQELADKEQKIFEGKRGDVWLKAYVWNRKSLSPRETQRRNRNGQKGVPDGFAAAANAFNAKSLRAPDGWYCKLLDGDAGISERFQPVAARAGLTLGRVKNADAAGLWLYRLFRYLQETRSYLLFLEEAGGDGIITKACEASVIFCDQLEKEANKSSVLNDDKTTRGTDGLSANGQQKPLKDRENRILEVIRRELKGRIYCRELDNAVIAPPRNGVWKEGPRKYMAAYDQGSPWRHRIEDEKSKIKRKAKLAGVLAARKSYVPPRPA